MSEEIAALTNAEVTYERVPGAIHADPGARCAATIRAFITAEPPPSNHRDAGGRGDASVSTWSR